MQPGLQVGPFRSISKPHLSRLLLVAAALIVAAVLLIWTLGRGLTRPRPTDTWLGAVFYPAWTTDSVGLSRREDARRFRGVIRGGTPPESDPQAFWQRLKDLLGRGDSAAVILYLSAVGVSMPAGDGGDRAFLLIPEASSSGKPAMLPLARVFGLIGSAPRSRKVIVILDAGLVDTDRDQGIFANGFLDHLSALVQGREGLAVLASCAPGQVSWASESDCRSVFGHFVAEGLAGKAARRGRVTARGLFHYVQPRVYNWVKRYRDGAIQTPVLLCKDGLDFPLDGLSSRGGASKPLPPVDMKPLRDELLGRWRDHEALTRSANPPLRRSPILWRQYEEVLLHAERLVRAGDARGARAAFQAADELKEELGRRGAGRLNRPRSWAMAETLIRTDPPNKSELIAEVKRFKEAIDTEIAGLDAREDRADSDLAADPGGPRGGERPSDLSMYVEGLPLIWYRAFVGRFGGSDPLKERRIPLLRRIVDVCRLAEEAASADERISRWIRPGVEAGDRSLRDAQDLLFGGDPEQLEASAARLVDAEQSYRRASAIAGKCRGALDLVLGVLDEAPRYGEWNARDGRGLADRIDGLLGDTARLADHLDGAEWTDVPAWERAVAELERRTGRVEAAREGIAREFKHDCRLHASGRGPGRWRALDALLRVPMIPAEERRVLLEAIMAPDLSPTLDGADEDVTGELPPTDPDPAIGTRAHDLARLETGLLAIGAGGDHAEELAVLRRSLDAARASSRGTPTGASDAFDLFSERVRALRAGMVDGIADRLAVTGLTDEEIGRRRVAADRIARVLPPSAARRLVGDPAVKLDEYGRYDLLLWHNRRIKETSPRHALLLLGDAGELLETGALEVARSSTRQVAEAGLTVEVTGRRTVELTSRGDPPQGHAVILYGPRADGPPSVGPMVAVPITGRIRLEHPAGSGELRPGDPGPQPAVFYRGEVYAPEPPPPIPDTPPNSVQVEFQMIHGYPGPTPCILDPKEVHPVDDFLQYKLILTNKTDRPLVLCIGRGLRGIRPREPMVLTLAGNAISDIVGGFVFRSDFGDGEERGLRIIVNEGDGRGRLLCPPQEYRFRKRPPVGRE